MKLLFIKLGKAISTIRRDGIIKGGKRVFLAFFSMFNRVRSGDILFITGGVGDSARYRCWHVSEELGKHGFNCSVTLQDNPFLSGYSDKFRIFIFHRTTYTSPVRKLIEKIKDQKKEIIFETDDLVFDPKYLKDMDYFKNMNIFEKKLYENGVGGEILQDSYVKICTTTTTFLAKKLEEYNKKVFVVTNKLSDKDLEITDQILKTKKDESEVAVKIGYFSGTISHNRDFAVITDALLNTMEKYPRAELYLFGPLKLDEKLNEFGTRIKRIDYVPRARHFENVNRIDINLAPLEIGNPFCESKSELKFFEAGILGVPTVAIRNQTFSAAILDGTDGFLAGSTSEWTEKIGKLIENSDLRKTMGEKAREKCLKKYTNKSSDNEEYYNYLRSRM